MILEYAPRKHDDNAKAILRGINKDIVPIARDRNIIVHGVVHSQALLPGGAAFGDKLGRTEEVPLTRLVCWTIYKGAEAGKNFPVSSKAVKTVRKNVQQVGHRIVAF